MTDSESWRRRTVLRTVGAGVAGTAATGLASAAGRDAADSETAARAGADSDSRAQQATTASTPGDGASDGTWTQFQADATNSGRSTATGPRSGATAWAFDPYSGDVGPSDTPTATDVTPQQLPQVVASPAVADGSVYVGSTNGSIYALDRVTGEQEWSVETDGPVMSSPTVVDDTVYVGSHDATLYALEAETSDEVWTFEAGDRA